MTEQTEAKQREVPQSREYLSAREVGIFLGIGTSSVWRKAKAGVLPKPVRIGGSTRWRRSAIEQVIAEADA